MVGEWYVFLVSPDMFSFVLACDWDRMCSNFVCGRVDFITHPGLGAHSGEVCFWARWAAVRSTQAVRDGMG